MNNKKKCNCFQKEILKMHLNQTIRPLQNLVKTWSLATTFKDDNGKYQLQNFPSFTTELQKPLYLQ